MGKAWELLLLIVIASFVVQVVLDFLHSFAPFIAVGIFLLLIGSVIYRCMTRW